MTYPDPERSNAVIIGVSTFKDPSLPALPSVRNNVEGLGTCLRSTLSLGLRPEHCSLVTDPARPHEVFEPLRLAAMQAQELLLVYYAGHGLLEGDDGELHLGLGGTTVGDVWTSVPMRGLARLIADADAVTKVLILDCCFSGRALRAQMSAASAVPIEAVDVAGTYVLTSSPENKPSVAPIGEMYTAFTGELLDILNNGLDGQPRDLTFAPIFDELRKRLRRRSIPLPQQRNVNGALNLYIASNQRFGGQQPIATEFYCASFIRQYENFDLVRAGDEPRIVEAIARDDLRAVFVPQECTTGDGRSAELDIVVQEWLGRDGRGSLVLLGEYGYGKTSYCLHLTYTLLRQWQRDSDNTYFPIFLSFRDFVPDQDSAGCRDAEERIVEILLTRFRLITQSADFPAAMQGRRLLLIFDGLDEIEKSLDVAWIRHQFQSTSGITRHFAKIIITCRASYLPDVDDVRRVLSTDQYELIVGAVARGTALEVVTLLPFDVERKIRYVELAVADPRQRARLLDVISRTPDLPDLTTRPVLLWMVVNTFRERGVDPRDLSGISLAGLYEKFTRQWLEFELDNEHIGHDVLENLELMHRIALKIYDDPSEQIPRGELLRELTISFPGRSQTEIARLEHEFVVCSFFRPSQVGYFAFVHRSFMEFFVARAYLGYINELRPESFGRQRLRPGLVARFLAQLIELEHARHAESVLVRWLQEARPLPAQDSHLGSNAATVLCHLSFRFQGLDLSEVDLRDADLGGGDFRYVRLRNAQLDNALLRRTRFAHADLEGADLRNVFISETEFTGANLRGAQIKNPRIIGGPDTIWIALHSRDDRHVVVGTDRGSLIVLRNDGTRTVVTEMFVHASGVMSVAFSADGAVLGVTNRSREIYLYDWPDLLAGVARPTVFADNSNYVRWLEFAPDDERLASGARDLMVKIWRYKDEPQVTELRFHVRDIMCVTWSPDGVWLASAGYDGTIAIWDTSTERPVAYPARDWKLATQRGVGSASVENWSHLGTIRALTFSPGGLWLASSSEDHTIKIWSLADPSLPTVDTRVPTIHDVTSLIFVEDGAALVAGDSSGNLFKFDLQQGEVRRVDRAHASRVRSLDVNSRRDVVLSSSWDGTVKVWNVNDLSLIETVFELPQGEPAYRPEGGFRDANISGVRELEEQFRDYFMALGAIEEEDSTARVDQVKGIAMPIADERNHEPILDLVSAVPRTELHRAIIDTVAEPWYQDVFCGLAPGTVPSSSKHLATLLRAGVIDSRRLARYRLNAIGGRSFLTDGLWRRGGVFPFTDETELLLGYCREYGLDGYDEIVDPASGCGHTAVAFPGLLARRAFDVDARAVEFVRVASWLNDVEVAASVNDITRGFPPEPATASGSRVLFLANMPFAISPYAGALSHVRDGGENGIKLSLAVLEAVRPFVGTGSRLVILTYSLGRDPDSSWQFVEQARKILPDCEHRWVLTEGRIWRVGADKVESNPMPLNALKKKAFSPLRSEEEQRRLRDGYDRLAKDLQSLGWGRLGCGILDVSL